MSGKSQGILKWMISGNPVLSWRFSPLALRDSPYGRHHPKIKDNTIKENNNAVSQTGPEVIKLFFMLNSVEHEILNAHKNKKYQEICFL